MILIVNIAFSDGYECVREQNFVIYHRCARPRVNFDLYQIEHSVNQSLVEVVIRFIKLTLGVRDAAVSDIGH